MTHTTLLHELTLTISKLKVKNNIQAGCSNNICLKGLSLLINKLENNYKN